MITNIFRFVADFIVNVSATVYRVTIEEFQPTNDCSPGTNS